MKAKNWKKIVKKKEKKEEEDFLKLSDLTLANPEQEEPDSETSASPSLDDVLSSNESLKKLIEQREALERQMANLTGQSTANDDRYSRFAPGEIPSIKEKQRRENEWIKRRKEYQESQKATRKKVNSRLDSVDSGIQRVFNTNVTPIEAPKIDTRFNNRMKEEEDMFTKVESTNDAYKMMDKNRDFVQGKINEKLKKNKPDNKFEENMAKFNRNLDQFEKNRDDINDRIKKKQSQVDDILSGRAIKKKKEQNPPAKKKKETIGDVLDKKTKKGKQKLDEFISRVDKVKDKSNEFIGKVRGAKDKFDKSTEGLSKMSKAMDSFSSDERFSQFSSDQKLMNDSPFKGMKGTADELLTKKDKISSSWGKALDKVEKNPIASKWDQFKKKKKEANSPLSKYKSKIDKILKVDVGTLEDMAKRNERLKQKALEKKKAEKEEEKKREEKREKRKEERKKNRKNR